MFHYQPNCSIFPFQLPELPYKKNQFKPDFSAKTFDYHHAIHHKKYISNLNYLLQNNKNIIDLNLEEIIKNTYNTDCNIFNNASQVWNHSFFWNSIKPYSGKAPTKEISKKINEDFGSYNRFIEIFTETAMNHFGSGWIWLVLNNNKLQIISTKNADTLLIYPNYIPLIICDIWEHAYYIDFYHKKQEYISIFLNRIINWDFALFNMQKTKSKLHI